MRWTKVPLGEVATISWGDTRTTKAAYTSEGFTAYSASGADGWLPHADHSTQGVVLSAIGAQCGKTWLTNREWSCIKNTMWFRAKEDSASTPFLYYATSDPDMWPKRGAAQPFIGLGDARQMLVPLPPLPTQHKIAAILSAYDDLIGNTNRRVKLLEETAQRIYRESFIDFRYPGHENVPLVDSELGPIPAGWTVCPFAALGKYVNGYPFKPDDWGIEGLPIIKIRELKNGVTDDTPRYGADLGERYAIRDGDLLFSWSADLDAYLWTGGSGWLNQHLFRVDPAEGIPTAFLFHSLREHMPEFRNRAQGTTMRHIKRSALDQVMVVVPPLLLRLGFAEHVASIDALSLNLVRGVRDLRAARDLLLPRLISGEIDVEDLDIAMADPAA